MSRAPLLAIAPFLLGLGLVGLGHVERLDLPAPTRTPHPPIDHGRPLPAARNGYAILAAAAKAAWPPGEEPPMSFSGLQRIADQPGPPELAGPPRVAVGSAADRALFAAVRRARSAPGFQIHAGRPAIEDEIPRYSALGGAAALLALEFRNRAARGDAAGGLPALGDALWIGRRIGSVPGEGLANAISAAHLTRRAVAATHRAGPALLAAPDAALAAFARDLDALAPLQVDLASTLAGDRDAFALYARGPRVGLFPIVEGWLQRQALPGAVRAIDAWGEAVADGDRARTQAIAAGLAAGYPVYMPLLHPLDATSMFMADMHLSASPADGIRSAEARFRGLRTEIAIARYRRAHGRPPATLDALVPAYLPAVPRDPFRPDQPLRWDGAKLWSVGPDGDDDGGAPMPAQVDREHSWPPGDLRLIPVTYLP